MEYRYVVVELRDGGSWLLYGDDDRPDEYESEGMTALPDLLSEGWYPVRETPVGAANLGMMRNDVQAYCLVLLGRDSPTLE